MQGDINSGRRHRMAKCVGVMSRVCILLYLIIIQQFEFIMWGVKFVKIISHLDMSFATHGINHKPFMKLDLHSGKCISTLFRIAENEFVSFKVTNPKNNDIRNGTQHAAPSIDCIYTIAFLHVLYSYYAPTQTFE
jgi:hypothetical protein